MVEWDRSDAWKRRQAEQLLARDLHTAGETLRLASLNLNDLTLPVGAGGGLRDSELELRHAQAEYARARDAWRIAMDRWVAFVKDGIVPGDLSLEA